MRKHLIRRVALAFTVIASTATVATAVNATAAHAANDCGITTWNGLVNYGNNLYVSNEMGYKGAYVNTMRARANVQSLSERLQFVHTSDGHVAIKSLANGKYVSSELAYTGVMNGILRARSTAIGLWEKFDAVPYGMTCALRSVANHKYVSAELGYDGFFTGVLRARGTSIGEWEMFTARPRVIGPPPGTWHCPQWAPTFVQYFGTSEAPRADQITWHESRCIPGVTNPLGCDGSNRTNSHAKGLMQICVPLNDQDFDAVGCHQNYFDGVCNIRAAKHLRDRNGWSPWNGAF